MVRSDLKGRGLGFRLMSELVAYARKRGLKRLFGEVLRENRRMLELAKDLGFTFEEGLGAELVRVTIDLTT